MKTPLVSIVVPIYNQEKYLKKSISCLLKQDYKNIQIVLVNDGSTDQSDLIIKKFENIDDRIKPITKKNGGLVDATITGIDNSDGDYIAFLDPDDYVGEDFIYNFVCELDQDYDFVARGFYYDKCGSLTPFIINQTFVYEKETISELRDTYLYSEENGKISQDIFFARWNKLYKTSTLKKAIEKFRECKGVTLGEDTIFTFLFLLQSEKGKSVKGVNSYYYNIGNQDSMMKDRNIIGYLQKAMNAYEKYLNILEDNSGNTNNALALYFFLIESLYASVKNNPDSLKKLYILLKKDTLYTKTLKFLIKTTSNRKQKLDLYARLVCPSVEIYVILTYKSLHLLKKIRNCINEFKAFSSDCTRVGLKKSLYLAKFRHQRKTAFIDLNKLMPKLDDRITSILNNLKLDYKEETVEKNIFVFWWDGFDSAPVIVRKCIDSVKANFSGYRIILISKENFKEYTDIDSIIISDFEDGKISIQTFSDVLRFNLLKNNGGMWIDSTIYFFNRYDLIEKLNEKQSFNTLAFSSSEFFLNYKASCTWSGFFIASKKNGLFVRTMDAIFREYYKAYGTYTLYFFIDAAFMVCKVNGVDDNVLMKTQKGDGDMFLLSKVGKYQYDESCLDEIRKIPQKLAWNIQLSSDSKKKESFFDVILG